MHCIAGIAVSKIIQNALNMLFVVDNMYQALMKEGEYFRIKVINYADGIANQL